MNTIEIQNSVPMKHVCIIVDQHTIAQQYNCETVTATLPSMTCHVTVEFEPFGICPIVRYNNFMLNYWFANIVLFDHKLELLLTENFFRIYKNKDIANRIDWAIKQQHVSKHDCDQYVGVNNLYPDLVSQIKQLLQ